MLLYRNREGGHPEQKPCHVEASASSTSKSHFTALFLHPFICGPYSRLVYCFVSQFIHCPVICFMPWRLSPFIWVNWRPTDLLLTPSCVFSISFIACVCSDWFFLIFSLCWCSHWFLHCSLKFTEHQTWPSLLTLHQISTYLHFIEVFPWSFIVFPLAQILLSFNFDWLSVCLYELGNTVASPSLEGMALCRCILVRTAHTQWFWREDWSWSPTWVRTFPGAHEGLPPWR